MMTRGLSLYLDAMRFFAALLVLLSHWAYPRFTGGDYIGIRHHDLGGDAVVAFFVLSGLVVTFSAEKRASDGIRAFAADRLSRLWSVALPALALTFILDPFGASLSSEIYHAEYYHGDQPFWRMLTAGTFTNELWFMSVRPGSNGPWWSLGYEAWFYAIFACAFFLRGRAQLIGVALTVLIAGPKVLLLMPSWLMGVWVWRKISSGTLSNLSKPAALMLTLLPGIVYIAAHLGMIPVKLWLLTRDLVGEDAIVVLRFSDTFFWSTILGVLVSANILGIAALVQNNTTIKPIPEKWARRLRWLAGGSFALYMVHYPLLQITAAALPGDVHDIKRQLLILVLPLIGAYIFAELTERRRAWLRSLLRRVFKADQVPESLPENS